jgi:glycosyltransferase involved in cell wall biosynthesis
MPPPPPRPRLTFFFPAYNEEENIETTVARALAEIGPLVPSIEVLAIDDGSTDRTPGARRRPRGGRSAGAGASPAEPWLRRGHQGGLRRGAGELICFSDGDLQFDLREMSRLLERLADERKPVDAVIGYRIKRRDPFHRIFIAKTYNAIVSVAFGLRVRDIDCAMKLFRREVFDGLRLDAEGPFLSAELLIKLRRGASAWPRWGSTTSRVPPARTPGRASGRSCGRSGTWPSCAWDLWTKRDEVLGRRG